jgi:hypothetical protein
MTNPILYMSTDDSHSSFQPEKPHSPAKSGHGQGTLYIVAAMVALTVTLIGAFIVPRLFGEAPLLRWLAALGGGALTFAVVVGIGWSRRSPRSDRHK